MLHCLRYQLHLVLLDADIFPSDTRIDPDTRNKSFRS